MSQRFQHNSAGTSRRQALAVIGAVISGAAVSLATRRAFASSCTSGSGSGGSYTSTANAPDTTLQCVLSGASCTSGSGSGGTYSISKPTSSTAKVLLSLTGGNYFQIYLDNASTVSAGSGSVASWVVQPSGPRVQAELIAGASYLPSLNGNVGSWTIR